MFSITMRVVRGSGRVTIMAVAMSTRACARMSLCAASPMKTAKFFSVQYRRF